MSKDLECVNDIQSILNMKGELSADQIDNYINHYISKNSVNTHSETGFTPLFNAAHLGNFEVTQVLLEKGADPDLQSFYGHSPLFIAAATGNLSITYALIQGGANVDLQDNEGKTPLMTAINNNKTAVAKYLIENTKNIDLADHQGNTALHYAFGAKNAEIIKYLAENNADMSIKNHAGVSGETIKAAFIESYNKIMTRKQNAEQATEKETEQGQLLKKQNKNLSTKLDSTSQKTSEENIETKKESTKFRDMVTRSRRESPNKDRGR